MSLLFLIVFRAALLLFDFRLLFNLLLLCFFLVSIYQFMNYRTSYMLRTGLLGTSFIIPLSMLAIWGLNDLWFLLGIMKLNWFLRCSTRWRRGCGCCDLSLRRLLTCYTFLFGEQRIMWLLVSLCKILRFWRRRCAFSLISFIILLFLRFFIIGLIRSINFITNKSKIDEILVLFSWWCFVNLLNSCKQWRPRGGLGFLARLSCRVFLLLQLSLACYVSIIFIVFGFP